MASAPCRWSITTVSCSTPSISPSSTTIGRPNSAQCRPDARRHRVGDHHRQAVQHGPLPERREPRLRIIARLRRREQQIGAHFAGL